MLMCSEVDFKRAKQTFLTFDFEEARVNINF